MKSTIVFKSFEITLGKRGKNGKGIVRFLNALDKVLRRYASKDLEGNSEYFYMWEEV